MIRSWSSKSSSLSPARLKKPRGCTPKGSAPHHVAVMALLDLAAEYLQAKSRTEDFKREVDRKSSELMALLETEPK